MYRIRFKREQNPKSELRKLIWALDFYDLEIKVSGMMVIIWLIFFHLIKYKKGICVISILN
ncbi:hypothetical protein HanIR_Chr05g0219031 [Helianthus annuus]|nr:hypothetical protein HanIR_Chr05g0219031 [Helianthus annuus]